MYPLLSLSIYLLHLGSHLEHFCLRIVMIDDEVGQIFNSATIWIIIITNNIFKVKRVDKTSSPPKKLHSYITLFP